jgi:proteasome accessory factor C
MAQGKPPKAYTSVVADVIHRIRTHGPLPVRTLADMTGTSPDEIRRQIKAYDHEETSPTLRQELPAWLYVEQSGDEPDDDADVAKTEGDPLRDVLGVEMFGASVYGPLYDAASDLLTREPGNEDLRSACETLVAQFLPGTERRSAYAARTVAALQTALDQRRRVRIVYSRAWKPGLVERIVEPYALTLTSRGYELDAGPVQDNDRIRSYLVTRIREHEMLEEVFDRPADSGSLIAANRATITVTGYMPHAGAWALRKWTESYAKGAADEHGFVFTAQMLPPVAERAALILILGGPDAYLDDEGQVAEAKALARELAAHHGLEV